MQRGKVSPTSSTGFSFSVYTARVNPTKVSKTKVSHDSAKAQAQSFPHPHGPFSVYIVRAWSWISYWPHLLTSNSVVANSAPISRVSPTPRFNQRISELIRFTEMGSQVSFY